jgi:hypothetical protein
MSNKTQLSNNNAKLASLIQELQSKANGGSGGVTQPETVDVYVSLYYAPSSIIYTTLNDAGEQVYSSTSSSSATIKCIVGTLVTILMSRDVGSCAFMTRHSDGILDNEYVLSTTKYGATCMITADTTGVYLNVGGGGSGN